MTEKIRTVSFEMNWTSAAHIIAAALEDGTGEGKAAARKELHRMAQILDTYRTTRTGLYEVIASDPEARAAAFGVALESSAAALAYAARLETFGYSAERLPEHTAQTLAEALDSAAEYFGDTRLPMEASG